MSAKIEMVGKKFYELKVEKEAGRNRWGQAMWECRCSCGNTCVVSGGDLRSGNTKSCGCLNLKRAKRTILAQTVGHSNPAKICSDKSHKLNTSGTKGVCPTKNGKWRAAIGVEGKYLYLGTFSDINDAIRARKAAEEKYYKPIREAYKKKKEE